MSKKCPKHEHFSNIDLKPLLSFLKKEIIKKRKPMYTTAMSLVFKFI